MRFQAAFGVGEDFRMMRLVRSFCIKEKGSLKPLQNLQPMAHRRAASVLF